MQCSECEACSQCVDLDDCHLALAVHLKRERERAGRSALTVHPKRACISAHSTITCSRAHSPSPVRARKVLEPIKLNAVAKTSVRTYDSQNQAYGGYGLFWTQVLTAACCSL